MKEQTPLEVLKNLMESINTAASFNANYAIETSDTDMISRAIDHAEWQAQQPIKDGWYYVKIKDLITEVENISDCFVVEFGGDYQLEITKVLATGKYKVTNGVDGWGTNCRAFFQDEEVKILTEFQPLPEPPNKINS